MQKTALVTGGSRGIGAACARRFAQDGYRVVINYCRSAGPARQLAGELGASVIQADVADPVQVEKMFDAAGEPDVLVCCAGVAWQGLLQEMSPEQWRRLFAVNVDGVFYCCRQAIPAMVRRKSGSIVTVSSMWGQVGASCEAAYSASKAAVIGLTKALAKELGPSGVRVNCVSPGVIDTDMNRMHSAETMDALREETPLGTIGAPEDVAQAAAFLASDRARFITGQIIGVNGGFVI